MNNILTNDTSKLVSIFTPILNTGSILYRTYESIKNQTYENWEWVVVDDGDDENTKKIMQDLSNLDLRIKYYDLNPKVMESSAKPNIEHVLFVLETIC